MSTDERMVLPTELREPYAELMKIAAELARGILEYPELSSTTPVYVARRVDREFDKADERCKQLALRIRAVIDGFPRVSYARVLHHVTVCSNCAGGD